MHDNPPRQPKTMLTFCHRQFSVFPRNLEETAHFLFTNVLATSDAFCSFLKTHISKWCHFRLPEGPLDMTCAVGSQPRCPSAWGARGDMVNGTEQDRAPEEGEPGTPGGSPTLHCTRGYRPGPNSSTLCHAGGEKGTHPFLGLRMLCRQIFFGAGSSYE